MTPGRPHSIRSDVAPWPGAEARNREGRSPRDVQQLAILENEFRCTLLLRSQ
jgi:hypothetical protein